MQHLTVKEIVDANLQNFDKLGATTGKKYGRYEYEDGTRCAIGIALTRATLDELRSRHMLETPLPLLGEIVDIDIPMLADVIQMAHDGLCLGKRWKRWGSLCLGKRSVELGFEWAYRRRDEPITVESYREFMEYLKAKLDNGETF